MLLNYLYSNFLEETTFVKEICSSQGELDAMIAARVFPAPSYIYNARGQSISFVSDYCDQKTYRFHLRGHADWYGEITQLGLLTESHARLHFFARFNEAKTAFFRGALGQSLAEETPDLSHYFNDAHAASTWDHFLNGVYGVCTRGGQPEDIFLKQAGVFSIEHIIAEGPGSLSAAQLNLLKRIVAVLERVESDFAPHEAPHVSRQRCIVDVKSMFLRGTP